MLLWRSWVSPIFPVGQWLRCYQWPTDDGVSPPGPIPTTGRAGSRRSTTARHGDPWTPARHRYPGGSGAAGSCLACWILSNLGATRFADAIAAQHMLQATLACLESRSLSPVVFRALRLFRSPTNLSLPCFLPLAMANCLPSSVQLIFPVFSCPLTFPALPRRIHSHTTD